AANAVGEEPLLVERPIHSNRDRLELRLNGYAPYRFDLLGKRLRDPKSSQLEGVRNQHHPGLRTLGAPAGVEAGGARVSVVRQSQPDSGSREEVARHAVHAHGRWVDRAGESLGGQVGEADSETVAASFDRQIEYRETCDDGPRQVGHRFDPLTAD